MSYTVKALLISLVAGTPFSYGSHSSSSASSSFQSSMSHSSGIASHGIISSGCGSIGCSPVVIPSGCGSIGCSSGISSVIGSHGIISSGIASHGVISSGIASHGIISSGCPSTGCSPIIIPSGCGSIGCSSGVQAFQSKLIKYQGFSKVPQTLLTQISSLLFNQIQSRKVVYANILDLCSRSNYDISLINTGLFKFFQENYANNIQYDLEAYYYNRIQTQASSIMSRIASQFSGINVNLIQKVMAQYLDYTYQGKTNFNFIDCFRSVGINTQSINVHSLQSMIVNQRQSLAYYCPEIRIPSFIFGTGLSHFSYSQTEMRAKSEFYSSFQSEFSQASFSSQSSYESFFSASRSKYSGCSVCLKEIDSLHAQAKTLSKSESSSVSIKQKLESSIKVESEFSLSNKISVNGSESSSNSKPSTTAPTAEESKSPVAPTTKKGETPVAPSTKEVKAPATEEAKAPTTEGVKAPATEEAKAPTTEEAKAPTTEGVKAPTTEEVKAPVASEETRENVAESSSGSQTVNTSPEAGVTSQADATTSEASSNLSNINNTTKDSTSAASVPDNQ